MSYILIIKYTEIFKLLVLRRVWINSGCIIFSVGERKFSPNAKFFAKK